ncbi:MAG: acyl-CoA mutase large subunit family protein [Promethearchaeota archaeon]
MKREAYERWKSGVYDPETRRHPERKARWETPSGIPRKELYTPIDLPDGEYEERLGFPGEYPFTRGVYPTMYRGRLWTMRQYAGFGSARLTNRRFRYLLEQGQKGLSVAFDLPTQMGLDSDDPLALGEVGRVGVTVNTIADLDRLFEGIPLEEVSVSFTINASAPIILAMLVALARKRGISARKLRGTLQNDILKEYVARGAYVFPPGPSLRLTTDVIEYCAKELPNFNPISISGYHMREAGCDAVQEVAFTIANGIEYVEKVLERGLDIDEFAGRLSFFFCAQNDLFEEVAKFRAARRLWASIIRDRFDARNPKSLLLRFHAQTAGVTLTAQGPNNNLIRVAYQALAAVLGGTQSLHTNSRDEALSIPTEESVRLALRTQQILAHETGVPDVVDPLAGSYYVEALTDEIEKRAREYIGKIGDMGGMAEAIRSGYVQSEIEASAYSYQLAVESGERPIVGVNLYPELGGVDLRPFKFDESEVARTLDELAKWKRDRNEGAVAQALASVREAARSGDNIMPVVIEAVLTGATTGEVCGVFREVFGVFKDDR